MRIVSEHAFGRLKGCFPSLKDMGHHDNIQDLYKANEALLILHNICIDWGDAPEHIWKFNPDDPPRDDEEMPEEIDGDDAEPINCVVVGQTAIPSHETEQWLKEEGYRKRLAVLDELSPMTNYM